MQHRKLKALGSALLVFISFTSSAQVPTQTIRKSRVPTEIVMTPYKTTMLAEGDSCVINLTAIDAQGREVPEADNMVTITISGPGRIIGFGNDDPGSQELDKYANGALQRRLFHGKSQFIVHSAGEGTIRLEATAAGLYAGSTDIITVPAANTEVISTDKSFTLSSEATKSRPTSKMLGADISFLPELEARGMKFFDKGVEKDAIEILKEHGFNYVRLRIFNEPANDSGYSPGKGFCDLEHTKAMAKRVKAAGMKFLLDFHYSDYWADPGKQYKPAAWRGLAFPDLKQKLYEFTKQVIYELKAQGTTPDMVQVGNEINHGIVWPEGSISHPDSLAQLLQAGIAAVKSVDPAIIIMLHVALGGQNDECVFFYNEMQKRHVFFDVIGLSYYPKWHGTLDDLRSNMLDLEKRYDKDIIVVEYSAKKEEVNALGFELPGGHGKGTCIWEPLSTWERIFDKGGKSNELISIYDDISSKYLKDDARK